MSFDVACAELALLEAMCKERPDVLKALDLDATQTCAALRYALSGLRAWAALEDATADALAHLSQAIAESKASS